MMSFHNKKIQYALENNEQLVLFLDYDGTLADFSKHPDIIDPKEEVIELIKALANCKNITPAIISGRRLEHIQKLIPISNIVLAGTYGLEIQMPGNKVYHPLEYQKIRPELKKLKQDWQALIKDTPSIFLEDKGWTLAIHALHAEVQIADEILQNAEEIAHYKLDSSMFEVHPGHKFLEASPQQANKGQCVKYLMNIIPTQGKALIYMGDDDKDEQAFAVVQSHGGIAIRVCSNVINNPIEDWRLENPKAARRWLWKVHSRYC